MNAPVESGSAPIKSAGPEIDTGLASLVLLSRFHGVVADAAQIAHENNNDPFDTTAILLAAKKLSMKARAVRGELARLATTPLPAIARDRAGQFFVIAKSGPDSVLIQDPKVQRPEVLTCEALQERWSGELILFASRAGDTLGSGRFDFTWFVPAIVKYRKLLGEVFMVSLVVQCFALVTPLFFQVVMDKVLVHRSYSTLDVIAVGLLAVVCFEVLLNTLRSYVFSHTTSRIDVELSGGLFRHLLGLPLAYFHARRVGDSVARVRELESIRAFLTGQAVTAVLDLLFSVIFIAVMFYYSGWLTLIVVLSLPCYALVSLIATPVLRARLNEKFNRGAENQAFLVETIAGIDTVKAMAVDSQWTRKWDQQLAGYVSASFRASTVGMIAGGGISLIGKLVTVGTLWLGARLVIEGDISVGQLIAFNMLAGQVAAPVMRLAQLWPDFQQVGISVERLGDILNAPRESSAGKTSIPPVRGEIAVADVTFRYRPDSPVVLKNISLRVASGEVIGIVGASGSGKSTVAKLIQRLYLPDSGRIAIDGIDLSIIEPTSLRRQIGVVAQENMLFNRTIRQNIALIDPSIPLEKVVEAAKLAGAHDFVSVLPEGYDTLVGEHGSTLSGGQRQRIAIARALLGNPRILIFDEATSALDYESEQAIQKNMKLICKGRSVVIIAHRLSAVRHADRIVVMSGGTIAEEGTHDELLKRQGGLYAKLYSLQAIT